MQLPTDGPEGAQSDTRMSLLTADFAVDVDTALYPRSVVVRACYALGDRCDVFLEQVGSSIRVHMKFKASGTAEGLRAALAEALVDFALREIIEARTATIRDIIVRTALAEAMSRSHADTGSR